jgi:predicted MPP superfamily phosphohydrolase
METTCPILTCSNVKWFKKWLVRMPCRGFQGRPSFYKFPISNFLSAAIRRPRVTERLTAACDPPTLTPEAADLLFRPANGFSILLAHSPKLYREASCAGVGLYLCGHSHGVPIFLPVGKPLMTCLDRGKRFDRGLWRHGEMIGHTSHGCGTAKIPVRFNCPPEITLLTLA